ncbi:MAG TPA: phosphoribosyltransferase family protein [Thermosynechococcaceae cyanobacterium]
MSLLPFQNASSALRFADRHEAGEQLAQAVLQEVTQLELTAKFVVYALPKGGLPIAQPIAQSLNCPLDVIVAKKITRPDNPELAIGAVTADGYVVWDSQRHRISPVSPYSSPIKNQQETTGALPPANQDDVALQEAHAHAHAQLEALSPNSPRFSAHGAIALLVDDGIATGMKMAAAIEAVRAQQPAQLWICAPVAPAELMPFLQTYGDRVIILATPHPFYSVSRFYKAFPQVTMAEAAAYLQGT